MQSSKRFLRPVLFTSILCLMGSLCALTAWTKVEYDSNQLMMKTADQVSELVRKKIKRAQEIQAKQEDADSADFVAEPAALEQLKDALRIVLARPDQDGTRANAFARLRRELVDLNSLDSVIQSLAREGISALKSDETPVSRAGTYLVVLDNLMAELKPEIKTNEGFKKVIILIRDANIKLSDKMKNQQRMRSMSEPNSPSVTAGKIIPK